MSNKYIELVEKWLADKDSVTPEELEENKAAAQDAYLEGKPTADRTSINITIYASCAADAAAIDDTDGATHWVERCHELKRYHELTGE